MGQHAQSVEAKHYFDPPYSQIFLQNVILNTHKNVQSDLFINYI